MEQWNMPKVVIEKFRSDQYIAACRQLVTDLPNNAFYLDWNPADGYKGFIDGEEVRKYGDGIRFTNPVIYPRESLGGISAYNDYDITWSGARYTDQRGVYNVYVYDYGYAYLYVDGYFPPETPTSDHNFS